MTPARAVLGELLGLFVSDWPQTLLILATLAGGWWLSQYVSGGAVGFGLAALLVLELIAGSLLEARDLRG